MVPNQAPEQSWLCLANAPTFNIQNVSLGYSVIECAEFTFELIVFLHFFFFCADHADHFLCLPRNWLQHLQEENVHYFWRYVSYMSLLLAAHKQLWWFIPWPNVSKWIFSCKMFFFLSAHKWFQEMVDIYLMKCYFEAKNKQNNKQTKHCMYQILLEVILMFQNGATVSISAKLCIHRTNHCRNIK